jgi:hypothetical protein
VLLFVSCLHFAELPHVVGWVHLASMLFPCHVLSLSYVYILCSHNTKRATYIFNFIVFYTHNTYVPRSRPRNVSLCFAQTHRA